MFVRLARKRQEEIDFKELIDTIVESGKPSRPASWTQAKVDVEFMSRKSIVVAGWLAGRKLGRIS
jgi:hypothetical protein